MLESKWVPSVSMALDFRFRRMMASASSPSKVSQGSAPLRAWPLLPFFTTVEGRIAVIKAGIADLDKERVTQKERERYSRGIVVEPMRVGQVLIRNCTVTSDDARNVTLRTAYYQVGVTQT